MYGMSTIKMDVNDVIELASRSLENIENTLLYLNTKCNIHVTDTYLFTKYNNQLIEVELEKDHIKNFLLLRNYIGPSIDLTIKDFGLLMKYSKK